jgi:hypothetical protein
LEYLLNWFDLGASTAENDPLLEVAKIETQEYYDLYHKDRIDIVKGIKGSGKTALYRLFYFLKEYSIENKNLFCIFGIEASGDPVFRLFYKEFKGYTTIEFENFWNIYFILLINSLIENDEAFGELIGKDKPAINNIINDLGIKISGKGYTLKDSISAIQKIFQFVHIKAGIKTEIDHNFNPTAIQPIFELEPKILDDIKVKPIYISEFRDRIKSILEKHGIRIWIMLDRLDEVFPHRSEIEMNGLKGLLKSAYNFSCENLRIKIFLRDDVLDFVSSDGFTALTHITDRCSSTMTWSKDDLLLLIVKRLSAIQELKGYYSIDNTQINNVEYRKEIFYKIFPEKIGKTETMEWIFTNCADGNNVVTPRDILDFFKYAKNEQLKAFKVNPREQEKLIEQDYFKIALDVLSKHKKITYLFAEFPHLKEIFTKLEGGYSEYDVGTLKEIFQDSYSKIIDDLKSIGFIKYVPKTGTYRIPVIWRKGLNIRRKKAIKEI